MKTLRRWIVFWTLIQSGYTKTNHKPTKDPDKPVRCLELIQVEDLYDQSPVILVHGGAGATPEDLFEAKFSGMKEAVRAGHRVLMESANVLDAVEAAIHVMEDDPAFNAGRGSKLNIFGHVEMDASIMDGAGLEAGAVASITGVRHPVSLARAVMENTSHVLVVGSGADRLASKFGVERVEEDWLVTQGARDLLEEFLKQHNLTEVSQEKVWRSEAIGRAWGHGTVGAVAFYQGHVAAATSTGGITGKLPGRVGDSPLLGHGVFADNMSAGVSCTGTGETFMRSGVARRVGWLVEAGTGPQEAVSEALEVMRTRVGGSGGVISVDRWGQLGIDWNSETMAWAWARSGEIHYGINRGDDFVEELE